MKSITDHKIPRNIQKNDDLASGLLNLTAMEKVDYLVWTRNNWLWNLCKVEKKKSRVFSIICDQSVYKKTWLNYCGFLDNPKPLRSLVIVPGASVEGCAKLLCLSVENCCRFWRRLFVTKQKLIFNGCFRSRNLSGTSICELLPMTQMLVRQVRVGGTCSSWS